MNINPKFSVFVLTYNQKDYIKKTIESILNQTFQDFEIIVNDDCSKDDTLNIVKSFNDKRIKYIQPKFNKGINCALNNLFKEAKGEYMVFIAGDDTLRKNHLETMLKTFEQNPDVDTIYCQLCAMDKDGNFTLGDNTPHWYCREKSAEEFLHEGFIKGNFVPSPGMTFKRKVGEKIFPQPCSVINFQDFKMHVDILINGFKIKVLDDILVNYRRCDEHKSVDDGSSAVYKRWGLETKSVLDDYLLIKDIEFLKRIFKKEIDETGFEPYLDTIPFFLGKTALSAPDEDRKNWGYHTLIEFLSKEENFNIANQRYGFNYKSLLDLVDFAKFPSVCIKPDNGNEKRLDKKLKKYKKLFKIFLIVSIVLFIALVFSGLRKFL